MNAQFLNALITSEKRTFVPRQFAVDNDLLPSTVYRNLPIAQSLGLVRATEETVFRSRKFGAGGGRSRVWMITARFVLDRQDSSQSRETFAPAQVVVGA